MEKPLLIGAHMSAAGGVHNALYRGKEIGATTIQLFTSNQRQWKGHPLSEDEVRLWNIALKETELQKIMSHSNYLINLGSPNEEILQKSLFAFKEELERCHLLNISYLVFHPGSALTSTEEECLDQIIKSLLSLEPIIQKGPTKILLETTAGQGTNVGYSFEHLAYIIDHVKRKIPIGVCIDTCHSFAAGYDIRTKSGWLKTLSIFDQLIGIEEHLSAFHLNDSLKGLGERKDRHASLGKGQIGLECFSFLMTHPKTRFLPKYLETPEGDIHWKEEISLLYELANPKKK